MSCIKPQVVPQVKSSISRSLQQPCHEGNALVYFVDKAITKLRQQQHVDIATEGAVMGTSERNQNSITSGCQCQAGPDLLLSHL